MPWTLQITEKWSAWKYPFWKIFDCNGKINNYLAALLVIVHQLIYTFVVHFFDIMVFHQKSIIWVISSHMNQSRCQNFEIWPFYNPLQNYYSKSRDFREKQELEFLPCFRMWVFLIPPSMDINDSTKLLTVRNLKNIVCLFRRKPLLWKF